MSKYADILKKEVSDSQTICSEPERIAIVNKKPKYIIKRPPKKRGDCSYDRWEYSYFPHLVNMYRIICQDDSSWDSIEMYEFFRFLYDVSSGEISGYLDNLTKEQEEAYHEYRIKRNEY